MALLTENNFGVVILCPDLNTGGLRYTANSLKADFPGVKYVCLVGQNAKPVDIETLSKISPICRGGRTITSLMDAGLNSLKSEWCLIVMSGSMVKYRLLKKYRYFSEENTILFPVIDRKYLFDEASINGIFIQKKAYEDIGTFGEDIEDLKQAKLLWAGRALEKGYKFKALVGVRFI